jgi:hypothetical protein
MTFYWAKFQGYNLNIFRFDTRVYLNEISEIKQNDICIGGIVGKNPGSAKATDPTSVALQPIILSGDNLLPNVRSIVSKAYDLKKERYLERGYVQVLNLFYLCDPDIDAALNKISYDEPPKCKTESNEFPWIWYVWGDENKKLSKYKTRFNNIKTKHNWFYDQTNHNIQKHCPTESDFARHTQGLLHDKVIPYLSKLI